MQINATTFLSDHRASFEKIAPHFAGSARTETASSDVKVPQKTDKESIERIKAVLEEHNISLQFSTDSATNAVVVRMVDERTGDEIRQFPTEVSLKLAANFLRLQGHFINANE